MNEVVKSPITLSENVEIIRKYSIKWLISRYKKSYNLNISYLFKNYSGEYLILYKCLDTGLEFFYPYIEGDSSFYEKMSQQPHYYDNWKWENEMILPFLNQGSKILDIGCGNGDFIANLNKRISVDSTGLELNKSAVKYAQSKKRNVKLELLSEHAVNHTEYYDFVCSFQVLEHISNLHNILQDSTRCLKKGGILSISVPNNDTYFGFYKYGCGNMPPHHVVRWNEQALRSLAPYFGLKVKCIITESLEEDKLDFAQPLMSLLFHNHYIGKILFFLKFHLIIKTFLSAISKWIKGPTIIAIYEKE